MQICVQLDFYALHGCEVRVADSIIASGNSGSPFNLYFSLKIQNILKDCKQQWHSMMDIYGFQGVVERRRWSARLGIRYHDDDVGIRSHSVFGGGIPLAPTRDFHIELHPVFSRFLSVYSSLYRAHESCSI